MPTYTVTDWVRDDWVRAYSKGESIEMLKDPYYAGRDGGYLESAWRHKRCLTPKGSGGKIPAQERAS